LSDQEKEIRYESGGIVINVGARLDEIEREQVESKRRDAKYKDDQLATNRNMARFTLALVLCSIGTGAVAIWQATIAQQSANAAKSSAEASKATLDEVRNGSFDTHELAVQAKNQAERTKDIADRALAQATATKKLAEQAAQSNKIAVDSMRQAQRPWIGPDIKVPVVTGAVTIDQRGMISTNYQLTAVNYGNYGANNINFWAQLYVAQDITTIWDRSRYACSAAAGNPNMGRIMFPGQERIMTNSWPAVAMDVIPNNKANPPYKEYQVYLLTCIGYRDQFSIPHHTGTIFRGARPDGESIMFELTPNSTIPVQWREWHSFLD
jgi:hypothetical protein